MSPLKKATTMTRPFTLTGLLFLAALGLIGWAVTRGLTAAGSPSTQTQPYTFYLFNAFAANKLVPLDPETLDDQPDGQVIDMPRGWRLSADGSTTVSVETSTGRDPINDRAVKADEIWIVVRDLPAGLERSRFQPPAASFPALISDDGTRLLLDAGPLAYPAPAEWYVFDTSNGRQLAHVKDEGQACRRSWSDPALLHRIYCLATPQADGLQPIHIIAYDVASGARVGELLLPNALSGGRETGRIANDQPVWALLEPAVELSSDGQALAIVHADEDKITLVDTQGLSVERIFSLNGRTSLLDLFRPGVAYAKGETEGTIRQAVFSLDGRYLYVFTQSLWVHVAEAPAERGLWVIDLERGAMVAKALPEFQVQWVRPAPDGSVYVFGTSDKRLLPYEIRPTSPSTLWRLDALTLKTLAQREFTGYRGGRVVLN